MTWNENLPENLQGLLHRKSDNTNTVLEMNITTVCNFLKVKLSPIVCLLWV